MSSLSLPLLHITIFFTSILVHSTVVQSNTHINITTCRNTCGGIPIKYPFGTGFGCGHPSFSRDIICTSSGSLQLSTTSGIYTISSIDYTSNALLLADPLMSNCSSMQNSGSFRLDPNTPFTISMQNIFVLLGCSLTSSVFDRSVDLCDTGSRSRACRGLYSCKGVMGLGLQKNGPVSSCCVYDSDSPAGPVGPGFVLDLPKLQCSSYSSVYGFGDDAGDPMRWRYGILLEYNGSYYGDGPRGCRDCEASGGFCGFEDLDQSFSCVCKTGVNTSTNCLGQGYAWSGTWVLKLQTKLRIGGILVVCMLLSIWDK